MSFLVHSNTQLCWLSLLQLLALYPSRFLLPTKKENSTQPLHLEEQCGFFASRMFIARKQTQTRHEREKGRETIRNLRTPASAEMNKVGVLIAGVPNPLSPIPLLFSLPPNPLPLSTPFTQAKESIKIRANA